MPDQKFATLDAKKIKAIEKLAADLSIPWVDFEERLKVSARTAKKYGEPIRAKIRENATIKPVETVSNGLGGAFVNDPDVKSKLKELELLKIEAEIEKTKKLIDLDALETAVQNLALQIKRVIRYCLDDSDLERDLLTMCAWCGENQMGYCSVDGVSSYVCASCGATVSDC